MELILRDDFDFREQPPQLIAEAQPEGTAVISLQLGHPIDQLADML